MSEHSRSRRGSRALLLAPLVVLAVAGCASVPTSGPVRPGGDLRLERVDDGVPFIGQPPVPGASPEDIVLGFLQSSADFVNDHEVAREYLTPSTRQRWRPQAGTVVYDGVTAGPAARTGPSGNPAGTASTVSVEASEVGRIDAEGSFQATGSGTPVSRDFRLEKVGGEWRVASLDDGLLLSRVDVLETYRQMSLYFLAPSGGTLVPDSVLIPEVPGLTTKLVARLLRGPTASVRDAVGTAFPQGTTLEVGSVPVRDGVATVSLDSSALQADDEAREQMSAQIVWTLKQLPEVLRVHITAGGEDLLVSGVAEDLDRDAWPTYDPDELPASPSAYVVRDGRVGRYLDGDFEPVPGAAGSGEPALRTPAVSIDAGRLAAVSSDGSTVYVGALTRDGGLEPRVRGADLSQPSWDPGNNLWVVDRATGAVWYLADGADRPQQVTLPRIGGDRAPTSVAVARDGARVALVVGAGRAARMVVGGVRRVETADPHVAGGESLSVVGLRQPLPDLKGVRDVSWADATTLAVLGSLQASPLRPYYVATDGYTVQDVEPLPDPVTITAVPPLQPQESPLVVGTADGQLQQFTSGSGWQSLGAGRDPAYPG